MLKYLTLLLMIINIISAQDSVSISLDNLLDLSLEEILNLTVTTASKNPETIREIPASVVILTNDEIKRNGYKDINEILQNIPGFYKIDDYFWLGSTNFGVRGFFSAGPFDNVIIMVNGINQVGDSYAYYPETKINVPVEAIQRIEIIKGPMSIIYGSGAFFGAVNIITNEEYQSGQSNEVSASIGSFGLKKVFARHSVSENSFHYNIVGSISQTKGINVPFTDMTSDVDFLGEVGLSPNSTTENKLDDFRRYLGINGNYDNIQFDFVNTLSRKDIFDAIPSISGGTELYMNTTNAALSYNGNIGDDFSYKINGGYFHHQYYWDYNVLYDLAYAVNNVSSDSYEITLDGNYSFSENGDVSFGFSRRVISDFFRNYDYPDFSETLTNVKLYCKDQIINDAFYTQIRYKLFSNLIAWGGIRFERLNDYTMQYTIASGTPSQKMLTGKYDDDEIKFIPRAALIWNINEVHLLKVMYGEAIKHPSLVHNFAQVFAERPQLKPSKIRTAEVNYIFTPHPAVFFEFSLFHNELNNLIVKNNIFDPVKDEFKLYSTNLGRMSTRGGELSVRVRPIDDLDISFSITYQECTNREAGYEDIHLGYSPSYLGYFNASYKLNDDLCLALNSRYVDDMESGWDNNPIDPNNGDFTPKGRIGAGVPDYFVINANLCATNVLFENLSMELSLSNIFDEEVRYPATKNNEWADKGTLDYGRRISFTIGYAFY